MTTTRPRRVASGLAVRVLAAAVLTLAPQPLAAELVRVDVRSRSDVLGGQAFGTVGAYEKVWGTAHFALDPAHPRNRGIADLSLAPRGADGRVHFTADLFVLRPKDPARGNGVVFFDVVNRGRFRLLSTFSHAAAADDPTEPAHFGDGSLLAAGYTLVAVGWQFDVPDEL
ncbi:MAG: hypothetical protein AB7U83_25740, partial [Vicinamibacterales bacterium]